MRVDRPWGWYEHLQSGKGYKVKRLLVFKGQQLSLQRHHHRSESWTVASGDGSLLCNNQWVEAHPGVMLTIPVGAVHRARGGHCDLVIIEVQHGDDLREEDIERLQDDYGRVIALSSTFEA
jgi:mannose-1-phosphate guanylyltransferase